MRHAFILFVAIPVINILVCSGIGSLLAGPDFGMGIATALVVVLILFYLNSFVSWLFLRPMKQKD